MFTDKIGTQTKNQMKVDKKSDEGRCVQNYDNNKT